MPSLSCDVGLKIMFSSLWCHVIRPWCTCCTKFGCAGALKQLQPLVYPSWVFLMNKTEQSVRNLLFPKKCPSRAFKPVVGWHLPCSDLKTLSNQATFPSWRRILSIVLLELAHPLLPLGLTCFISSVVTAWIFLVERGASNLFLYLNVIAVYLNNLLPFISMSYQLQAQPSWLTRQVSVCLILIL
jgi:hypothetical protein